MPTKKKITPGRAAPKKGYRTLRLGEIIRKGDQVYSHGLGPWQASTMAGFKISEWMAPIRRLVSPKGSAKPAKSPSPKSPSRKAIAK